jgi:outer membrane protein OmpA-like peptidoglycan-associated protein
MQFSVCVISLFLFLCIPFSGIAQAPDTSAIDPGTDVDFPSLYFNYGDTVLTQVSMDYLDCIFETMKEIPDAVLHVDGHTDFKESIMLDSSLSLKRARHTVDYLIKKGIDPSRFRVRAWGNTQPANGCKNCLDENKNAFNRRVRAMVCTF